MSGPVVITDAPVSMVMRRDLSLIYPSVLGCYLPSLRTCWVCNKGSSDGTNAFFFFFFHVFWFLEPWSTSCGKFFWRCPCLQSHLIWPVPPHCQHTGCTILSSVTGSLAVAFAATYLRVWLRALSSILLPPMRKENFTSKYLIPSINVWTASLQMKYWGIVDRGMVGKLLECWRNLLNSCALAFSWEQYVEAIWWSP